MRKFLLYSWLSVIILSGLLLGQGCKKDASIEEKGDLMHIPYDPKPYKIIKPPHFPEVPVPPDNPMTVDGVQLGRRLFYDPILSADSTQSCSSCHMPHLSFTDGLPVSVGIDGIAGRRSSMSLLNIAYATNGLFWDGRVRTLEEQALLPVEDPIELHNTWPNVIEKLKKHPVYPELFRKAFGIRDREEITKELAAKAIAQFERILISSGTSRFDRFLQGDLDALDDEELDGKLMFFEEGARAGLPDAQCFHCHGGFTLTGNQYFNNGIDEASTLDDFKDKGRGPISGRRTDNGKFRTPTLRNIALTAPYMHDGRFQTLEDVLDHYSSHGKNSPNKDPLIDQIGFLIPGSNPPKYTGLTPYQKRAIIKFLHTLTDTAFINNPDIQNPFK
ncbi:MAG: cytochrome C peroxidase [Saprospiraceae bacterium]|nr:cytochrome C peroxidase [Saprospiraceae bacterium]MDW8484850.1 cytochrome c peroxidase [Saprospiraceae bacterium]